jgi:formylglycine-generating enzyme required for sulfatase activity
MGLGDRDYYSNPAHKVILDAYWIDQTEVTNVMYAKCVADGVCKEPFDKSSFTRSSYYGNSKFNDYPVIYVDSNMAKSYCEWRGDKLPSEAQWEKAARGTDGRIYPWGDNIDCSFANYYWVSPDYLLWKTQHYCAGDTTRVGSYEGGKSPYGLYDMIGNVSEWVADWDGARYEPNSLLINPIGPDTGVYRMTRGGSWRDASFYDSFLPLALSVISDTLSAFEARDDIGFRCVSDASP